MTLMKSSPLRHHLIFIYKKQKMASTSGSSKTTLKRWDINANIHKNALTTDKYKLYPLQVFHTSIHLSTKTSAGDPKNEINMSEC